MNIELPKNEEAERLVLGRMMNSINCVNAVYENLEEVDFFNATHRAIFRAGYNLFIKDRSIDATSLLGQLHLDDPNFNGMIEVIGMERQTIGSTFDHMQFIEIVRDFSIYRKIINFNLEMMNEASLKRLSSEKIKLKFLEDSDVIFKALNKANIVSLKDVVDKDYRESGKSFIEYLEYKMDQYAQGKNTIEGYLSGYNLLDHCLEGFNKKHYMIIGARPGVGKTTFILNLMKRFAEQNIKVGFFSLEMSRADVAFKYTGICCGIDLKNITRGVGILPLQFQEIVSTLKNLDHSIFIDDQPNLAVSQLVARAKRMVLANGVKIVFIDYLSEVKGEGRFQNKQEEIQHVSKSLRAMAKTLNIPVVCIAQLNRESEKADRLPIKSDLRESGQIEADAYSIMLLHRDEVKRPGILSLSLVKNRMGSEAHIDFHFNSATGEINEMGFHDKNELISDQVKKEKRFLNVLTEQED
jgi:replicative DNA helicase